VSIEGSQMLIQKLRLQRGWSQEQLAEISGLSVRTIQRLERGQTASVESLKALAAAFEIDFSDLREPDMNNISQATIDPATMGQHTLGHNTGQNTLGQGLSPDEALALAHVRKLRGFYIHLAQYVLVIAFLTIVNLLVSPSYFWVLYVAFGWGVGVAFHGLRVFDKVPFLNGEWERRQVEKHLGRKL
jgi:transcriptional regulator with XRE-family HTH domain